MGGACLPEACTFTGEYNDTCCLYLHRAYISTYGLTSVMYAANELATGESMICCFAEHARERVAQHVKRVRGLQGPLYAEFRQSQWHAYRGV